MWGWAGSRSRYGSRRRLKWGKGIHFIVAGDIDVTSRYNTSSAVVVCSGHQFVWPAAVENDRTSVSIVTVESLVPRSAVVFRANHPGNHVITAIG
jgi:hypothetical protein